MSKHLVTTHVATLAFGGLDREDKKLVDYKNIAAVATSFVRLRERVRDKGEAIDNTLAAHYIKKKSVKVYSAWARFLRAVNRQLGPFTRKAETTTNPIVIYSSPTGASVVIKGWVVSSRIEKPLEDKLEWEDVRSEVDWDETLAYLPLNRILRPLNDVQRQAARKRLFAVMASTRARELIRRLKQRSGRVKPRQRDLFKNH